MNNIEYIEFTLIGIILVIQVAVFIQTIRKIYSFKEIIPTDKFYSLFKIKVPSNDLSSLNPEQILTNAEDYYKEDETRYQPEELSEEADLDNDDANKVEISFIHSSPGESNMIFEKILRSINGYLIRNKGAVADFNLIKDIVDRNCDAEDEEIHSNLPIPLYLGLMGTMLGIVFGLGLFFISINKTVTAENGQLLTDETLGNLIGGVAIAMIAAFMGLLLTTIGSGIFYKGAKSNVEGRKNEFFTFIQVELLPILSQNVSSSLYSLQKNLLKFNEGFTANMEKFEGIMNVNYEALTTQEKVLSRLEKMDMAQLAKTNITVLKELQKSTTEFEKFNSYLKNVNSFVKNSNTLTEQTNELLAKVTGINDSGKKIADEIIGRLEQSEQLLKFLYSHFNELESRKKLINDTVVNVDDTLQKSLKELSEHTQSKIESFKELTIKEEDMLANALQNNRNSLTKLEYLEKMHDKMSQIDYNSPGFQENVAGKLDELNKNIAETIMLLKDIRSQNIVGYSKNIASSVAGLFNRKKK